MMSDEKLSRCLRKLDRRTVDEGDQLIFGWIKQGLVSSLSEFEILNKKLREIGNGMKSKNTFGDLYRIKGGKIYNL